jgi:hypothetical protein
MPDSSEQMSGARHKGDIEQSGGCIPQAEARVVCAKKGIDAVRRSVASLRSAQEQGVAHRYCRS